MYELYYWPGLPGRGEFVRLVLEQAGLDYIEVGLEKGVEPILALKGSRAGFAPPYLKQGELVLAQTPAICAYLGQKYGLSPTDPGGAARVLQLLLTVADVVAEVHDTHHPVSHELRYEEQTEPAKLRAATFTGGRLAAWLEFFSKVLREDEWLVDDTLSVADLSLFQLVEGLDYAFPNAFGVSVTPQLAAHRERVAALPRIDAYLKSRRRQIFNEMGIFRRYPELDIAAPT